MNYNKRAAAGTIALAICLSGGAIALAGAANADSSNAATPAVPAHTDEPTIVILTAGAQAHIVDTTLAAPLAAALQAPVLLTTPSEIDSSTAATIRRIDPDEIIIVGGSDAVSTTIETQAVRLIGGDRKDITRLAGQTRYDTARAIADALSATDAG
jgi:putative cell wall-binding protein